MAVPTGKPSTSCASNSEMGTLVRTRISTLSYLPTTAAVAVKFVELGRNPDAEPAEYSKVISSDCALSAKLIALANSSWFGVRNRITKVQVAVNLLGLGTVRTLAIGYCLTGLHNELRLTSEESRVFWSTSLCKAIAARQFIVRLKPDRGEDAFAAALFQDFALPVMYSVARDQVDALLRDASLDSQMHLAAERALFRMDHCEFARALAQKLELPEFFVDAVGFHHNPDALHEFLGDDALADALVVASLFPHVLQSWNPADAQALRQVLAAQPEPVQLESFLVSVQLEFDKLFAYFVQDGPPEARLADILVAASKEAADSATRLVGAVHELLQQAASAGTEVQHMINEHDALEEAATHDPLTGALNRKAFIVRASELIHDPARQDLTYALVYIDLDHFKEINDREGHGAGDTALKNVVAAIRRHIRKTDLVARFGGDEFVILLRDCGEKPADNIVQKINEAVSQVEGGERSNMSVSAGVVHVPPGSSATTLDGLLSLADAQMYRSKRAGGNCTHSTRFNPPRA